MVNKPLIRPYFLGGVALGGVASHLCIFTFKFRLAWLVVEPPQLKNMLVKLDHFPRDRGENKTKIFETPPSSYFWINPPQKKKKTAKNT